MKILFMAANPTDTTPLRLGEESRNIDEALRQTEYGDQFELEQAYAVRVKDLENLLQRHRPHIVHFSGHGSADGKSTNSNSSRDVKLVDSSGYSSGGIILEDEAGNSHPVSSRALSKIFALLKGNIRCVVLNACYSEPQALAINEHIDCVVGMSTAIEDRAAISFATAFYQALGYGADVRTAFELGRAQLELEHLPDEQTPQLLATKVDPSHVVLVTPGVQTQDSKLAEMVAQHLGDRVLSDERKFRLLRALIGEDNGRSLYGYKGSTYYQPALDDLVAKGQIRFEHNKYFLTHAGWKTAREYLMPLLKES